MYISSKVHHKSIEGVRMTGTLTPFTVRDFGIMKIGQVIMIVLWALLALASFASAIFVAMPLVWKIVGYAFGVYNFLIILGLGWSFNKNEEKQE